MRVGDGSRLALSPCHAVSVADQGFRRSRLRVRAARTSVKGRGVRDLACRGQGYRNLGSSAFGFRCLGVADPGFVDDIGPRGLRSLPPLLRPPPHALRAPPPRARVRPCPFPPPPVSPVVDERRQQAGDRITGAPRDRPGSSTRRDSGQRPGKRRGHADAGVIRDRGAGIAPRSGTARAALGRQVVAGRGRYAARTAVDEHARYSSMRGRPPGRAQPRRTRQWHSPPTVSTR